MAISKKKIIKSLDSLSEDLKDLVRTQYPAGYDASISRISNGKKEPLFVFPLETDDATYLVTKNSSGGYDVDDVEDDDKDDVSSKDDDFGTGDDVEADGGGDDDDYEGGGGKSREASYDPDFDS
jgi:hypothetical protein